MSTADIAETCPHRWELTDVTHTASGRKWQQIAECFYCPDCRQFSRKVRWFLDGDFFKQGYHAELANQEENVRYKAAKQAWLSEHYPEHVEVQR